MQIDLFKKEHLIPLVLPDRIDYRNVSCNDLIKEVSTFEDKPRLVYADPPWGYNQSPGSSGSPNAHYKTLKDSEIADTLDRAYDAAAKDARLLIWCTWPKLYEFINAFNGTRWRYVSGGSWHKVDHNGIGYHWLGSSEPVLLYKKGAPPCRYDTFNNAFQSQPEKHSVKPVEFLEGMLTRWLYPEHKVLDLYAGLGSMALACYRRHRGYIGAELDPQRYDHGMNWLHARGCARQSENHAINDHDEKDEIDRARNIESIPW